MLPAILCSYHPYLLVTTGVYLFGPSCRLSINVTVLIRRAMCLLLIMVSNGTVGASSSVTRRVLAEIVYVIYYEVWPIFILVYKSKG